MKAIVCIVLAGLLIGSAVEYRDHVYGQGVAAERSRRDEIDRGNSIAAALERSTLNTRIAATQRDLLVTISLLDTAHLELKNEKAISESRQSALLAGRERERVLVRATGSARPAPDPNRQAGGTAAGRLDQDAGIEADLDPRVASWLEGVRADHNAAVERLGACIASYDAVKAAADAMP